jgi:hypothetical protein
MFLAAVLSFIRQHLSGTVALVALSLLYGASIGGIMALINALTISLGNFTT